MALVMNKKEYLEYLKDNKINVNGKFKKEHNDIMKGFEDYETLVVCYSLGGYSFGFF